MVQIVLVHLPSTREVMERRADRIVRDALAGRRGVVEQAFALASRPEDDGLGKPEPILAWTPAEREAFGLDDTDRFIVETEQELKRIEWDRIPAPEGRARPAERDAFGNEVVEIYGDDRVVRLHRLLLSPYDERMLTYSEGGRVLSS